MNVISLRLGFALLLGAAVTAAGAGISIAHANAVTPAPVPISITGSLTLPIVAANNESTGPGLYGYSRGGVGIVGKTKFSAANGAGTEAGIVGIDISSTGTTNNGVLGTTASGGFGLRGISGDGAEGGVGGFATSGVGVVASSSSGLALYGSSTSGTGAIIGSKSGTGAALYSDSGTGLTIFSNTGTAASINGNMGNGVEVSTFSGYGATINSYAGSGALIMSHVGTWDPVATTNANGTGNPAELVAGAGSSPGLVSVLRTSFSPETSYVLAAQGFNAQNKLIGSFSVNALGDVHYSGKVSTSIRTRSGIEVTAYSTKSTESTVEDTGTSQLIAGTAVVQLDAAYAQSMDLQRPYRVFLTPDGDTRGLYVAQKTATAFLVRETQGGHGTFAFDYRIVAAAAGSASDRMTISTSALRSKLSPMSNATSVETGERKRPPHQLPSLRDVLKSADTLRTAP